MNVVVSHRLVDTTRVQGKKFAMGRLLPAFKMDFFLGNAVNKLRNSCRTWEQEISAKTTQQYLQGSNKEAFKHFFIQVTIL